MVSTHLTLSKFSTALYSFTSPHKLKGQWPLDFVNMYRYMLVLQVTAMVRFSIEDMWLMKNSCSTSANFLYNIFESKALDLLLFCFLTGFQFFAIYLYEYACSKDFIWLHLYIFYYCHTLNLFIFSANVVWMNSFLIITCILCSLNKTISNNNLYLNIFFSLWKTTEHSVQWLVSP